jgi:hypothetical protein
MLISFYFLKKLKTMPFLTLIFYFKKLLKLKLENKRVRTFKRREKGSKLRTNSCRCRSSFYHRQRRPSLTVCRRHYSFTASRPSPFIPLNQSFLFSIVPYFAISYLFTL